MQAMSSDNPGFFIENSTGEVGNQTVRSPSEGSSEMETSSFDASIRHFIYSDSPTNASTTTASAASPVSMRLKPGNKKSFVWNYFRHPESESGILDRTRTQCLLCKSQLAFNASGTTTTMLNHLKSRHGEIAQREESQRVRSSTSNRRKETSTSRSASTSSYSPLRAHQQPAQPPQSQIQPSRTRHSNGCSDFPKVSEDLRKFPPLKEDAKQGNPKTSLLQPFLALSGLDSGGRHGSPQASLSPESIVTAAEAAAAAAAAAAASRGLLPPSVFLGGLPPAPTVTSASFLPPLFPIPPPLESTPLMPQLAGFLPSNFASFVAPNSSAISTFTEDAIERLQSTPHYASESGPLAVARAWLSTLTNLPGQPVTNGDSSEHRASTSPPSTANSTFTGNFAAMEELLKSLPTLGAHQGGDVGSSKSPLTLPLPRDLLSTLVHNNPLVLSLISRSQALLASQGCIPPPPPPSAPSISPTSGSITPSARPPSILSSGVKNSSSTGVDLMIGTAKRKRTRPVYIPPQMRATKRSPTESISSTPDSPEDLSMPRATRQQHQHQHQHQYQQQHQQQQQQHRQEISPGWLESRLAYFLIREMLPPEVLESEAFKTLVNALSGSKALAMPRITARRMRMEILPQIANTVLPTQQQHGLNRNSLAVEFWRNVDGRHRFANLTVGCGGRLLQTALLKCPRDVKKIIVDCVRPSDPNSTPLPRVLVTNRPEELAEIMSGDFIIVPCYVTALATAVTSGLRTPAVTLLLQDIKESVEVSQSITITSMETITWREVVELFVRVRADRLKGDVWQLKCLLDNLGKSLDYMKLQEAPNASVSLIAPILVDLRKTCLTASIEDSEVIKAFKTTVNEGLDAFYPRKPTSLHDLLLIAGLTDPRVRSRVQEFAPHAVTILKEKVEELSRLRDKDTVFVHTARCEVDRYLREEVVPSVQTDSMRWWSERQSTYPLLSRLAQHYLNIPLASFSTKLRLKPLPRSAEKGISSVLPDGLNLPNYCDIFAQLKMNLSAEDMLIYTFLWHNWSLPSSQET